MTATETHAQAARRVWKAGLVGRAKRQPGYFWRISREGHRALEALADALDAAAKGFFGQSPAPFGSRDSGIPVL